MSSAVVSVEGVTGVRKMLSPFLEPELSKELQVATKKGAEVLRGPLKSALRPVSKRMAGAVSIRRAKRERPATIVGSRRKKAFFWHMVIGGTKAHGPRVAPYMVIGLNALRGSASRKVRIQGPGALRGQGLIRASHVRGVPPNPIVGNIADLYESRVQEAMDKHIASRMR